MKKSMMNLGLLFCFMQAIFPAPSFTQIYTVGNDDGFSFACAGSPDNELFLPVSVTRFEAFCIPNGTRIEWSLPPEGENGNITLEKSYDGKIFRTFSATILQRTWGFECIDNKPGHHIRYFRLRQQAEGNLPEYSNIIASVCKSNVPVVSPNPSNGKFTIQMEEPGGRITIRDVTGKCVYEKVLNEAIQTIDAGFLQSGIYVLDVDSELPYTSQRIIIAE
jgi:hypothetical protein